MLKLVRFFLVLLVLAAVGQQLVLHLQAGYSALNFFSYFTNLSNLFAALVLLLSLFLKTGPGLDFARYVSAVNMAVVGVVFSVLLRSVDLGGLLPWVNTVLHYLMPVAVVLDWLLALPAFRLPLRHALWALIFPALYLVYAVVRGAITGWYPYPFLNPEHAGGQGAVAAYAVGISIVFLLFSVVLLKVGQRAVSSTGHGAIGHGGM